eukprot:gnl/MRDRNA2_/MRDRNA2_167875_c0_seq1.p1 gnl/MRDRNA2_/MRDRNA2_167875_c0~~gnl/MRDRNA2_/MRDRNA2_167875_c0_seq1.p1  ORF type:complete len:430 (-),score=89.60 gnl/MRDRNA2_/MRDRNA2_167875_c0_seq1:220-1476(-)
MRRSRVLRRLQTKIAKFEITTKKADHVKNLLNEASVAYETGDARAMCSLLLTGASYLKKPTFLKRPMSEELSPMSEEAIGRVQLILQSKVRKAIQFCLQGLDLEDQETRNRSDVDVALTHIQHLLEGNDLDLVVGKKDWIKIRNIVTRVTGDHCASLESGGSSPTQRVPNDENQIKGRFKREEKVRSFTKTGVRKRVLLQSLRDLGGAATVTEVKEHIVLNPKLLEAVGGKIRHAACNKTTLLTLCTQSNEVRHGEAVMVLSTPKSEKRLAPGAAKSVMIRAMKDLGGQATMAEIREHVAAQHNLVEAIQDVSNVKTNLLYSISTNTGEVRHGEPVMKLSEEALPMCVLKRKDGYRGICDVGRKRTGGRRRLLGPSRIAAQEAAQDVTQLKIWKATLQQEQMIQRIQAWPGATVIRVS